MMAIGRINKGVLDGNSSIAPVVVRGKVGVNGGVVGHESRRNAIRVQAGTNGNGRCGGEVSWGGWGRLGDEKVDSGSHRHGGSR